MNNLAQQFMQSCDEQTAISLVRASRCNNFHNIGTILSKFLETLFPNSVDIKDEQGIMFYYINKHRKAYRSFNRILSFGGLSELKANSVIFNKHFCIDAVKNDHIKYDQLRINKLFKTNKPFPLVTVTITSCKRVDLFTRTINSFVKCCKDINLVDEWLCVDDNSSESDRKKMIELYPFINFYLKTPKEKGHPQSMNIIRKLVKTPYTFHMEDDWQFFDFRNYISDCLEVLGQNPKFGQCLINRNYAETQRDHEIKGGVFRSTPSGLRYYEHEFCRTENEKKAFDEKYSQGKHCSYWPHFSFRPSLIRTKIYQELGEFNENISHFEMDYASRYVNSGYTSAFLEGVHCLHIGRLTSERNNKSIPNAYDLNNECQLSGKEEQLARNNSLPENPTVQSFPFRLKTFVVNLDRRSDRMEEFQKHDEPKFLDYQRFSAIDGSKLTTTSQLQYIFDNNDYNMRQGMVGCAMSHIKLCIQLLGDSTCDVYCILEDDLDFVTNFQKKLLHCANELFKTDWDMFYLGHHLWKQFIDEEVYSKTLWPKVEQFNRSESIHRSMGGTGGYMINKKGAEKLLNFINRTGMTNGIDTVQQKSADEVNIFYAYPHLIYSECYRGDNNPDTDIQHNYGSLTLSLDQRIKEELGYYDSIVKIDESKIIELGGLQNSEWPLVDISYNFYYESDKLNISLLAKNCKYPCYTLADCIIFVVPNGDPNRYFHRFKKNGTWNIDDALIYKSV